MVEEDNDNDEILGKYQKQVDISKNGMFVDIEIQNPDIQIAVEDGLFELYAYHENRKNYLLGNQQDNIYL